MKWCRLILRIARDTTGYAIGGALVFAVAGLAESILAGSLLALLVLPADRQLAGSIILNAIYFGTCSGFTGGLFSFALAGLLQSIRAEYRYYDPVYRHVPRDDAFWNCMRSALWASAMCATGGAFTGGLCGSLWAAISPPDPQGGPNYGYETIYVLSGGAWGASLGYFVGIATGALAPHSVQTARRRVKEWRRVGLQTWRATRTEWQQ